MEISSQRYLKNNNKFLFPKYIIFHQISIHGTTNTYKCYNELTKKICIIRIINLDVEIRKMFRAARFPDLNELFPALNFRLVDFKNIVAYNIGNITDSGIYNNHFYYCSEFINGTTFEHFNNRLSLDILCKKLLACLKNLQIYKIPFPYLKESSLILKNNRILIFANFNPKNFFIEYAPATFYAEKFIPSKKEIKHFINSQLNSKIALLSIGKIICQVASIKKIEFNFKSNKIKQKLATHISEKFQKKFSTFSGFYFFFGEGFKKTKRFKCSKLEILILEKKNEIYRKRYFQNNFILQKLTFKILDKIFQLTLNAVIIICIIISLLVLTNFFLKTKKQEVIINNTAMRVINKKREIMALKNWHATSRGWIVNDKEINFICQSKKYTIFNSHFSFFIENIRKHKQISGIVSLKEITLLKPVIQARIDKIAKKNLNVSIHPAEGGMFFLSSKKDRAIAIIVGLNNNCEIVELNNKSKDFQVVQKYIMPCDSKNAKLLLKINSKRNLAYGTIGENEFSIKIKTKMKNTTWKRALGCCNVDCKFRPAL